MIEKLKIHNFQSYEDVELDFHRRINIIYGNSTSEGKTAIIRALQWLIANRPLGDRIHNRFVKEKSTSVETTVIPNHIIKLSKWGDDEGYFLDGEKSSGLGHSVPDTIIAHLNFSDINIQEQLSQHFLITSPPSDITKVINKITKLEQVDIWISKITTHINSSNKEIEILNNQLSGLLLELNQYDGIEDFEEKVEYIEKLEIAFNILTEKITKLSNFLSNLSKIESKIGEFKTFLMIEPSIIKLESDFHELLSTLNNIEKLEKLIRIQDSIRENQLFLTFSEPIILAIIDDISIFKSVYNDISSLENSINKLTTIENSRERMLQKLNVQEAQFSSFLRGIKRCPTCFSEFSEEKIIELVYEKGRC